MNNLNKDRILQTLKENGYSLYLDYGLKVIKPVRLSDGVYVTDETERKVFFEFLNQFSIYSEADLLDSFYAESREQILLDKVKPLNVYFIIDYYVPKIETISKHTGKFVENEVYTNIMDILNKEIYKDGKFEVLPSFFFELHKKDIISIRDEQDIIDNVKKDASDSIEETESILPKKDIPEFIYIDSFIHANKRVYFRDRLKSKVTVGETYTITNNAFNMQVYDYDFEIAKKLFRELLVSLYNDYVLESDDRLTTGANEKIKQKFKSIISHEVYLGKETYYDDIYALDGFKSNGFVLRITYNNDILITKEDEIVVQFNMKYNRLPYDVLVGCIEKILNLEKGNLSNIESIFNDV